MKKIDEAIDRIKILECPTGNLENRIEEILVDDYKVASKDDVKVDRDSNFDNDGAQGYKVKIQGQGKPIVVLAKSGYDDYVAKVVDVYRKL